MAKKETFLEKIENIEGVDFCKKSGVNYVVKLKEGYVFKHDEDENIVSAKTQKLLKEYVDGILSIKEVNDRRKRYNKIKKEMKEWEELKNEIKELGVILNSLSKEQMDKLMKNEEKIFSGLKAEMKRQEEEEDGE